MHLQAIFVNRPMETFLAWPIGDANTTSKSSGQNLTNVGVCCWVFYKLQYRMFFNNCICLSQGECTYSTATRRQCSLPASLPQSVVLGSCSLISFLYSYFSVCLESKPKLQIGSLASCKFVISIVYISWWMTRKWDKEDTLYRQRFCDTLLKHWN